MYFLRFSIIILFVLHPSCKGYINIEGTREKMPKYILKYSRDDNAVIDSVTSLLLADIEKTVIDDVCSNFINQEEIYLKPYLVGCITIKNDSVILVNTTCDVDNYKDKWPLFEELLDNIVVNKSFPHHMIKSFYTSINIQDTVLKHQLIYDNNRFDIMRE